MVRLYNPQRLKREKYNSLYVLNVSIFNSYCSYKLRLTFKMLKVIVICPLWLLMYEN